MSISFIVAMTKDRVIGKNNQLPWHLSSDLKRFKAITTGHTIVMGRKTFESIGKPLPNRRNIILTTDVNYQAEGCLIIHSVEELFKNLSLPHSLSSQRKLGSRELSTEEAYTKEIFIIGGGQLYETFLPYAQKIYLTLVDVKIEGDAFFPEFDKSQWEVIKREDHAAGDKDDYDYQFVMLRKVQSTLSS